MELHEADPEIVFRTYGGRQETLLHRAALHRRREMVQFLLEHGASQQEDVEGNTPLHCAALGGDTEVARALIKAGADLEAVNHELDRPLHLAASVGNLEARLYVLTNACGGTGAKIRHLFRNSRKNKESLGENFT